MHVYKLYPKKYCGEECLQRAMQGMLLTYSLNTEKITEMVKGDLMPQHVRLLLSVIFILYVGAHKLLKEPLKNILWVCHGKVYRVLLWLKSNNPKYFANVEISQEHLALLPQDNMPKEIMEVVTLEEFVTVTNCSEGVEDKGGEFPFFVFFGVCQVTSLAVCTPLYTLFVIHILHSFYFAYIHLLLFGYHLNLSCSQ